ERARRGQFAPQRPASRPAGFVDRRDSPGKRRPPRCWLQWRDGRILPKSARLPHPKRSRARAFGARDEAFGTVQPFRLAVARSSENLQRKDAGVNSDLEPKRSEEHTSELQSLRHLVCRLLLEKKKTQKDNE